MSSESVQLKKNLPLNIFRKHGRPEEHFREFVPDGAFRSMVQKEISDHVRSWRYIILLIIIFLTCLGSLYGSLSSFSEIVKKATGDNDFFFLYLFTQSNGTIPPFFVFDYCSQADL